jgi:hypothetical protein
MKSDAISGYVFLVKYVCRLVRECNYIRHFLCQLNSWALVNISCNGIKLNFNISRRPQ